MSLMCAWSGPQITFGPAKLCGILGLWSRTSLRDRLASIGKSYLSAYQGQLVGYACGNALATPWPLWWYGFERCVVELRLPYSNESSRTFFVFCPIRYHRPCWQMSRFKRKLMPRVPVPVSSGHHIYIPRILHGEVNFVFLSHRSFWAVEGPLARLLYWAASTHRLFLYQPISRCACGREDVGPDLPLGGDWQVGIGSKHMRSKKHVQPTAYKIYWHNLNFCNDTNRFSIPPQSSTQTKIIFNIIDWMVFRAIHLSVKFNQKKGKRKRLSSFLLPKLGKCFINFLGTFEDKSYFIKIPKK